MILKQNAFIISDNELNALEEGTYQAPQRIIKTADGLDMVQNPITYTGSSIQRRSYKAKKTITQDIIDCKILLRKKDITECDFNRLNRRVSQLEVLRNLKNEKKEPKERELSNRSKTKMSQKVLAWAHATKHNEGKPRFTFLTLTLTSQQNSPDNGFTKMQNVFFTYCRKYFGTKMNVKDRFTGKTEKKVLLPYMYVLEKQTKTTGNIHSHVILDRPLPIQRLNYIWCKILSDHGYTFPQKNKETGITTVLPVIEALKNSLKSPRCTYIGDYLQNPHKYKKEKPKPGRLLSSPNPADIKFIYNLKAVSHYITKYITKSETKINTSVWNCSESISSLWVGAKISALKYYSQLSEQTSSIMRLVLDEGHVLNICLLKYYTKIQQEIFSINKQYLVST